MRLYFLVFVPSLVACVSVQHERRGPEKLLAVECTPGRALATLDSMPDRVRLTFDRTDTCTQSTEVVWITDTQTELSAPLRWTFAGVAGLIIGTPIFAGVFVLANKSGSAGGKLVEGLTPLAAVVIIGAGAAAYAASGAAIGEPSATTQRLEVVRRPEVTSKKVVPEGRFSIEGGAPHRVVAGSVELSLEDALALRDGQLLLDGAPVDLVGLDSSARLRALPACRQALEGFDADTAKSLDAPQKQARLAEIYECRLGGWSFADRVLNALASRASP